MLNYYAFYRLGRLQSCGISNPECIRNESAFYDAICRCDLKTLSEFKDDTTKTSSFTSGNWEFIKRCAKAVSSTGNVDVMKLVSNIFVAESAKASEIGEIFALETIASGRSAMVTGLLQHWAVTRTPFVSYTHTHTHIICYYFIFLYSFYTTMFSNYNFNVA